MDSRRWTAGSRRCLRPELRLVLVRRAARRPPRPGPALIPRPVDPCLMGCRDTICRVPAKAGAGGCQDERGSRGRHLRPSGGPLKGAATAFVTGSQKLFSNDPMGINRPARTAVRAEGAPGVAGWGCCRRSRRSPTPSGPEPAPLRGGHLPQEPAPAKPAPAKPAPAQAGGGVASPNSFLEVVEDRCVMVQNGAGVRQHLVGTTLTRPSAPCPGLSTSATTPT